jgi:hypothetical protein
MKTIIQVWTQECVNVEIGKDNLYWGFGDMIRSTIFLHQFCLKKGYNLIVDHQFHPVSEFFLFTCCCAFGHTIIPFHSQSEVLISRANRPLAKRAVPPTD